MRPLTRRRTLPTLLAIGVVTSGLALDPTSARGATDLTVDIDGATAIIAPGDPIAFRVPGCLTEATDWRVTDSESKPAGSGSHPSSTSADAARSLPGGTATTPGIYRLSVTCGTATGSTRFVRSSGPAVADPFFGFAVDAGAGSAAEVLPTFQAIGGGSYRQDLQWQAVEKTPARFDFTPIDPRIDPWVHEAGVAPLFVLDYGNTAHTGSSMTPPDMAVPEQRAAWERFVVNTVWHLRERHPRADLSFEVWNEWNNFHGSFPATPEAYLPLAEVTFKAIRAVDPTIRVVGPGVNAVSLPEREWMTRWFELGGARWVDAISVHPYSQPWAPEECAAGLGCIADTLAALREQAAEHPSASGGPAPIWITEVGWPATGVTRVDEADLAAFLVRTHALAAESGVERVYTFELAQPNARSGRTFALTGGVGTGYEPRPAAAAYLTMQRMLAGMRVVGSTARDTTRQVEFVSADGRRHVRVVWQTVDRFADQSVTVPLPGTGTLVEAYGARKPVTATKGSLTMTAKWSPRYVVWTD
ncbi:hypothetical protein DEJ28_02730 [Curtobacterium sp. MCPF17_002]|uniref:GH39 family glycosyl hydrolase n=1 Tax=Curtobacterium sp. MCPF17_002 TaxID=2175645 RepID=UPI000DA8CBAB|nr:hypothetical protein [Curtobacterium sp. MCPF17_002]WIB78031.1 hypothetical protein DEJ28_02730 [Curtobacterium sp. MCPF17_002]